MSSSPSRIPWSRSLSSRAVLRLFLGQDADLFLEEKMDRHANGGQGGVELVRDRPDDAFLDLVLLSELGDVLEDQDDPCRQPLVAQDGDRFGTIVSLLAPDELLDGAAAFQRGVAAVLERLAEKVGHPIERRIENDRARLQPENGPGRLRGDLDLPLGIYDRDCIGKAVERFLCRLLDP
jgi:hypothetical protein